jgi:hypothetical protein
MTETTSIHALMRDRHTYAPPAATQLGVMTFIAQAVLGYIFGCFFLLVAGVLLLSDFYYFNLPFLPVLALGIGTPVGLIIWVSSRFSDQPLSRTYRATIAVLLLAIACLSLVLLYFWQTPTPDRQLALLASIFVPGIAIGVVTGSRLRPWRELVRAGDAIGIVPRIFAGLTGLILRIIVVLLFMYSLLVFILLLTSYPESDQLLGAMVAVSHLTVGLTVLFVRMRFWVLSLLTAIVIAPVLAVLWLFPDMPPAPWYVVVGYLIAWAMFLLARWRQTDVALAVLNKELRYYLID